MRLRVFALPRFALFVTGLLPALIWFSFHATAVILQKEEIYWVLGTGLLGAVMFTSCLRRGLFAFRTVLYLCLGAVILAELVQSVLDRDFIALGGALISLAVVIAAGLWLERKVDSASLNPGHHWFEGSPKCFTQVEVKVKFEQEWVMAHLRKIDSQGLFVFFDSPISLKPGRRVSVSLGTRQSQVEGEAQIASSFSGERPGLGLQFLAKDLYHFTGYTALVQELRGKGL